MMSFLIKLDKFVSLSAGSSACLLARVCESFCVCLCVRASPFADLTCLQMAMCYISITVSLSSTSAAASPPAAQAGMQLCLKSSLLNGLREEKMNTYFAFQ